MTSPNASRTGGQNESISGEGICVHKDAGAWETRVGWCCPVCCCIRHRHSVLMLVPRGTFGGITISTDAAVPIGAVPRPIQENK